MKIAITGGTGFVGVHLTESLISAGVETVLISRGLDHRNDDFFQSKTSLIERRQIGTSDVAKLAEAFTDCRAVAHCAGINREVEPGDYERIHVQGTRNVVEAAKLAGVKKIALVSFYQARPNCGSLYHESKYAAEEIVRNCGLDYTILKAGMIYGKGDHMLDHLSHVFYTLPVFGLVGFEKRYAAPLAIEDFVKVVKAALVEDRLERQTVSIIGPERLSLEQAVRRVAKVVGKTPLMIPMPIFFHVAFAHALEALMKVPLISLAQVRILTEGFDKPFGQCADLPEDLKPAVPFSEAQIQKGLPVPGAFGLADLRFCGHN